MPALRKMVKTLSQDSVYESEGKLCSFTSYLLG